MKNCPICGAAGNVSRCRHTQEDVDEFVRNIPKRKIVVFDPNVNYAQDCPFFEEYLDVDGCGEGWGTCRIWPIWTEDHNAEMTCPHLGPRGGVTGEAPEGCLLREFEMVITKKEKP